MPGTYFYPLKRVFLNLSGGTVTGDTVFTQGLYANYLSGGTIYSGATDLYDIFQIAGSPSTQVQNGLNTYTGGTVQFPTVNVSSLTINTLVASGNTQLNLLTAQFISGGTISGGTLFSGSTNLYDIFQIAGSPSTQVQNGINTYTGGTVQFPTVNVSALTINSLVVSGVSQLGATTTTLFSGGTISGGTLFSGSTNLYSIFQPLGSPSTQVQNGINTYTGGTVQFPTINVVDSPSFNGLFSSGNTQLNVLAAQFISGGTISGDTLYSGSTNLQSIFNSFNNQLGTKANLSGATFTGAISATAITATNLINTQVVYAGIGGLLKTSSGFTYDDVSSSLFSQNIQIGSPSLSGLVTIWGDVTVMGQAISAFTSQLLVEDNNISLNYNPTASTASTSLGAGFTIQDGSGIAGTDVFLDLRGTATTVDNRSFSTNLNDIRVRESGTTSSPNGARLLAEYDYLDGGFY